MIFSPHHKHINQKIEQLVKLCNTLRVLKANSSFFLERICRIKRTNAVEPKAARYNFESAITSHLFDCSIQFRKCCFSDYFQVSSKYADFRAVIHRLIWSIRFRRVRNHNSNGILYQLLETSWEHKFRNGWGHKTLVHDRAPFRVIVRISSSNGYRRLLFRVLLPRRHKGSKPSLRMLACCDCR